MACYEAAEFTKEELTYLDLRRKLKDHYRKQFKQESSASTPPLAATTERKVDDFGSFFGPSQPTVIPRVIKNTTSLLQFAVLRMSHSNRTPGLKKAVDQTCDPKIMKPTPPPLKPKVDPVKVKLQKMKEARDYSFLFSDDVQAKSPLTKKVSAPASAKIPEKGRPVPKERKPVSLNGKLPDSTTIRKNPISSDPKICDGAAGLERRNESNLKVASKMETITLKKKVTVKIAGQEVTSSDTQTNRKPTSKPITKPVVSSQTSLQDRPKKRHLPRMNTEADDGFDYRSEIRKVLKYDPKKYQDDGDTRNMEAGFHDILKEERKSALIARKEDRIEQKRIEEEARKERTRKRPKLS